MENITLFKFKQYIYKIYKHYECSVGQSINMKYLKSLHHKVHESSLAYSSILSRIDWLTAGALWAGMHSLPSYPLINPSYRTKSVDLKINLHNI